MISCDRCCHHFVSQKRKLGLTEGKGLEQTWQGVIWSWDWNLGQVSSTAVFSPLTYRCLIVQVEAETHASASEGNPVDWLAHEELHPALGTREMPGPEGWTEIHSIVESEDGHNHSNTFGYE